MKYILPVLLFLFGISSAHALTVAHSGHSLATNQLTDRLKAIAEDKGYTHTQYSQNAPGSSNGARWDNCSSYSWCPRDELSSTPVDVLVITEALPVVNYTTDWDTGDADPADAHKYALEFYNLQQSTNPGGFVYLFETWPCTTSGAGTCAFDPTPATPWRTRIDSDLALWQGIVDYVNGQKGATEPDMLLLPGGQAMARLYDEIEAGRVPGKTDITDFYADDIHLNDDGEFFMAMVHYASIYRASPNDPVTSILDQFGSPFTNPQDPLAHVLAMIAWDAVSAFYEINDDMIMGENVTHLAYWESHFPFIDLRTQSAEYGVANGTIGTDSRGNINDLQSGYAWAGVIHNTTYIPSGNYVLLYDHTQVGSGGSVVFQNYGSGPQPTLVDDATPGRKVYSFTQPADEATTYAVNLRVTFNSPINGDVDWHLLLPGTESNWNAGEIVNPTWAAKMYGTEIVRFMDLLDTNNSTITNVADLPQAGDPTWTTSGMPFGETMDVTRAVGADVAWITIPHLATDATIAAIAAEVYANWTSGIEVWVEYSNEVWNDIFTQTLWAYTESASRYGEGGISGLGYIVAHQSTKIKAAFESAFGANSAAIKLVVGTNVDFDNAYNDLGAPLGCYGMHCRYMGSDDVTHSGETWNIADDIDYWAVASYFTNGLWNEQSFIDLGVESWTDAQIRDHLTSEMPARLLKFQQHAANLTTHSVTAELVAYEFGQHVGVSDAIGGSYDLQMRDWMDSPEAGEFYDDLITNMVDGGLVAAANFLQIGPHRGFYWGSYEDLNDIRTPRAEAVEAYYGAGTGTNPTAPPPPPDPDPEPDPVLEWTFCANEWATCTFTGTQSIAFGLEPDWVYADHTTSVDCLSSNFGGSDPAPGLQKECWVVPAEQQASLPACANGWFYLHVAGTKTLVCPEN